MKKKLRSQKGLTLVEMLAATAVLALLAMMLQTGIALALRSYNKITATSEIQLLMSTVVDTLSNEFRYARDVRTVGSTDEIERYTSPAYGRNTTLVVQDGQLFTAGGNRLLASGAYANGEYDITDFTLTYNDGIFQAIIKIESEKTGVSQERTIQIACLNG